MNKFQSLKGKKAFKEVLKKGRRYHTGGMELIALKMSDNQNTNKNNIEANSIRVGIQVKKNYGNAVSRNRIRRRIKASLNEILRTMEYNFYIIIRPGNSLKTFNYSDSREIIASLLVKAGVFKL